MTHTEEFKARVITLYSEGQSFRKVAKALKLTPGQVAGIVHRYRAIYGEPRDGIGKTLRVGAHQHIDSLSSLPDIRIRK